MFVECEGERRQRENVTVVSGLMALSVEILELDT
jgi:hypothetical protein